MNKISSPSSNGSRKIYGSGSNRKKLSSSNRSRRKVELRIRHSEIRFQLETYAYEYQLERYGTGIVKLADGNFLCDRAGHRFPLRVVNSNSKYTISVGRYDSSGTLHILRR